MDRRTFAQSLLRLSGFGIVSACGCAEAWAQKKAATAGKRQPAKPAREADGWGLYTNQNLGFSARFPAEPRYNAGNDQIVYFASLNQQTCSLTVADNRMGASAWSPAQIKKFRAEVENDTMSLDSTKQIAANILEYAGWVKGGNTLAPIRGRVFLSRDLVYFVVTRAEPNVSLDAAVAETFFRGFKVIPRVLARNTPRRQNGPTVTYEVCYKCNGRGRIRQSCAYCAGTGKTASGYVSREGYRCIWCQGNGYTTNQSCNVCFGSGQVQVYR